MNGKAATAPEIIHIHKGHALKFSWVDGKTMPDDKPVWVDGNLVFTRDNFMRMQQDNELNLNDPVHSFLLDAFGKYGFVDEILFGYKRVHIIMRATTVTDDTVTSLKSCICRLMNAMEPEPAIAS